MSELENGRLLAMWCGGSVRVPYPFSYKCELERIAIRITRIPAAARGRSTATPALPLDGALNDIGIGLVERRDQRVR